LSERFADVPRPELMRDLLIPLRRALGNAYKHGNDRNPAKTVSVEVTLTRKGALIAITDEGSGFDVALTLRRFQEQNGWRFQEQNGCGLGFRNLHEARSTVSYENGGRTVLLCFRPAMVDQNRASFLRLRTTKKRGASGESLTKATDSQWIQSHLMAKLPEFANGRARLESCRVCETRGPAGDDCGNRYVLRVAGPNRSPAETRVLTGRLHATETAAGADFEGATRLREANMSSRLWIPRPGARPAGEPRLVLYDFDPWMNLWEYLTHRRSLNSLHHVTERVGEALAGLHRSQLPFRGDGKDLTEERGKAMVARTTTALEALPRGSHFVNCFRDCVKRTANAAYTQPRISAPIHGAFGWDCIHYGVDRRFYLYRFETCQRSDPRLDLGGFAADLLCFARSNHDESAYRSCLDAFLNQYNSDAEHRASADDLRLYISVALVE